MKASVQGGCWLTGRQGASALACEHARRPASVPAPAELPAMCQWCPRHARPHSTACFPLCPPQASAEVFNYFLCGNKDEKTIEMGAPLAHNFTMRERKGAAWRAEPWETAGWTTVDNWVGWER